MISKPIKYRCAECGATAERIHDTYLVVPFPRGKPSTDQGTYDAVEYRCSNGHTIFVMKEEVPR